MTALIDARGTVASEWICFYKMVLSQQQDRS